MKKFLCIILCALIVLLGSCSTKTVDSEYYTAIKECVKLRYFIVNLSDDEIKYVGKDKKSGREEFHISVVTGELDDISSELENLTLFVEKEDDLYYVYNEKGSNLYIYNEGKN